MRKITGHGETAREAIEAVAFMISNEDVGEGLILKVEVKPARVKDYENHIDVDGFAAVVETL